LHRDNPLVSLSRAPQDRQGATKLFAEKQSGARFDRPQLRKEPAALGEGDVLMVTRLDRLARSTRDLLNVLHEVAKSRSKAERGPMLDRSSD
jgi:DNA invertase Pin-like site-specific DNA recombinase